MIEDKDSRRDELTRLGLFGLTPFFIAAFTAWLTPFVFPPWVAHNFFDATIAYAGVIAGYMAGMGAGALLLSGKPLDARFLPSMIAALIAWIAIMPSAFIFDIDRSIRCILLAGVFGYLLVRDLHAIKADGAPGWYGPLRQRLTFWAALLLVLMAARDQLPGFY